MSVGKWKVLIADDEYLIGQLIAKLIKWQELQMECMDIVDNGKAAYDVILEKKPDIVITDIRMPKMSGLELVCMTKKVMEDVRFVIVSGYKEFEYAHKALQYGVNDYLLKPINEEELNAVMEKLSKELSSCSEEQRQQEELKKTADASRQIIKRDLLNHILEEQHLSRLEMEQEYNVALDAPLYRGIVIKLDYSNHKKTDKRQDRFTIDKVTAIVEQHLKKCVKEELLCEKPGMYMFCLFNYDPQWAKKIRAVINDILSEIQDYLLGFEQYVVTIGVGEEKSEFVAAGDSIYEAKRAVENRIKLGVGRLIYAEALHLSQPVDATSYFQPYKGGFIAAIEAYSGEALGQQTYKLFGSFQNEGDMDFSVCYSLALELIELFFENAGTGDKKEDGFKDSLNAAVCQCYSIAALKKVLIQSLGEYLETTRKFQETESVRPIRQARKYIDENYSKKVILEDIAHIVGLNSVYFSVLFKKETGMNFSIYLVHVRMEHAKLLLKSGNETIAAVAEKVGYKDTRYFSQTFAKTVGIKPALYRKLHQ